ncbi:MAG: ABC transporter permease [Alphaproteobacteria bacterium]|nr:ABC transporter permease [Alphaproteobacteria bacterium]
MAAQPPAPAIATSASAATPTRGYWATVGRRLMRDRVTMACALVLALILLAALLAPLIAPHDPFLGRMPRRLRPFGILNSLGMSDNPRAILEHPFGTDELGRDMLTRILYGGRLSLFMGVTPVFNALVIGGLLGIVAGFLGGWVNTLIMRTIDVFYAFPSVLLAIAISGTLGAGIVNAIVSLTVVFIPPIVRVSESVTTSVRTLDYVDAARASGLGTLSILRVHVLRNVFGPIFIYATSLISVSIILASGLSFLGLGVEPPNAEWGLMLNTLRPAIYTRPEVAALPGFAILVTSVCFNLLSDGLRSAMDVRI